MMSDILSDFLFKETGRRLNKKILDPLTPTPLELMPRILCNIFNDNNSEDFILKFKKFGSNINEIKTNIINLTSLRYEYIITLKNYKENLREIIKIFFTSYPQTIAYGLVYFAICIDAGIDIPLIKTSLSRTTYIKIGTHVRSILIDTMKNYTPIYDADNFQKLYDKEKISHNKCSVSSI